MLVSKWLILKWYAQPLLLGCYSSRKKGCYYKFMMVLVKFEASGLNEESPRYMSNEKSLRLSCFNEPSHRYTVGAHEPFFLQKLALVAMRCKRLTQCTSTGNRKFMLNRSDR